MGEALKSAYAEYLERMLQQSDDLVVVDQFTVPEDVDTAKLGEWADVE